MASTNGLSLPQFPHLENVSSAHPQLCASLGAPGPILFSPGGVATNFCSFPLSWILREEILAAQQLAQAIPPGHPALPNALPPVGCCRGFSQTSQQGLAPRVPHLGTSWGGGSLGSSGNTRLRTLWGFPGCFFSFWGFFFPFFLELPSWEGLSLRLPINLAA